MKQSIAFAGMLLFFFAGIITSDLLKSRKVEAQIEDYPYLKKIELTDSGYYFHGTDLTPCEFEFFEEIKELKGPNFVAVYF